ncbi:galactonate dehydratase [Candidatus Poribacteria bacterium]
MQITDVKAHLVNPGGRNLVFVEVFTDEGITGIGEAYSVGPDHATVATIHYFADWLKGLNPMDIEDLWARMYNGSRFPGGSVINSAISGIEHALWDISGKALGVPVYKLLGGKCRDKIRVYQSAGGGTPEALAESALALIEKYGYTALKIGPHPPGSYEMPYNEVVNGAAARMKAVRDAVGDGIDIGVDAHAKIFEPVRSIMMAEAIAPYRPLFFEEPLRPENIDALGNLASKINVPIATGEMLYTKYEFRDLLVRQAADIIQPDICCTGGILECRKIAAMAEAFYVPLAPHNPMGPVATAVNVHLAASIPNFLILEYIPDDRPPRRDLVKEPMKVEDGYIPLPTKPGLGIELNKEAFAKYPYKDWNRGFPHRADGSMAFI